MNACFDTTYTTYARRILSIGSIALLAAACSVAGDNSEATDSDLHLKPVGTETMSTLILQLPTGTCLPGGACARPLSVQPAFALDGTAMNVGGSIRVTAGAHTLTVGATSTTVTLVAGATRTMIVPVAKRVCTNATGSTLPSTDFGRVPTLRNAACPSPASVDGKTISAVGQGFSQIDLFSDDSCGSSLGSLTQSYTCSNITANAWTLKSVRASGTSTCINVPDRELQSFCTLYVQGNYGAIGLSSTFMSGDTAVVPGTYSFSVEGANGMTTETRTLAEGDVQDLAFTLPLLGDIPDRFNTNLTFADSRDLPDAAVAQIASNCERPYAIAATASGTLALKAFKFPECTYALNLAGRSVALTQSADNNITLHRVDIDDVVVTREDNSTYTTRGTWQLFFGGNKVAGPYNTNSGIDVLDGSYEIVVQYTTAEGSKTNNYNVTF